jgi:hypothetical protein
MTDWRMANSFNSFFSIKGKFHLCGELNLINSPSAIRKSAIMYSRTASSVGLERCFDRAEVIGSNPMQSTFKETDRPFTFSAAIPIINITIVIYWVVSIGRLISGNRSNAFTIPFLIMFP